MNTIRKLFSLTCVIAYLIPVYGQDDTLTADGLYLKYTQELKELAETLPPYELNLDCGFEAIRVFEEFGGDLVIAQQVDVDFVSDGIYAIKRAVIPSDMYERINGIFSKGWYIWYGKIYLSYPRYGFYEVSLKRRIDIETHCGINMVKNGAHVWNIIDDIVIDISWARQNMDTFLETVIVEGEKY